MNFKQKLKRKYCIPIYFDELSVHLAVITLDNMKKYLDHYYRASIIDVTRWSKYYRLAVCRLQDDIVKA